LHGVPGQFTYRRCADCATVYQDPRVVSDDLALCYPEHYYTKSNVEETATRPLSSAPGRARHIRDALSEAIRAEVRHAPVSGPYGLAASWLARSRRLRERAFQNRLPDELMPRTNGRALDVGCGGGRLLAGLALAGWDVEGLEVDPVAGDIARRRSGRPVHIGDFATTPLLKGTYELIVLHHVIEHIERPRDVLRRLCTLMTPTGRAVIGCPNPRSLGARLFGPHWFSWEAPRHLSVSPRPALAGVAAEFGLQLLSSRSYDHNALHYFALSRAYRERRPVEEMCPRIAVSDQLLAFLEWTLLRLGVPVGEDLLMVFGRRPPAASPRVKRSGVFE
jgi:2-polyprenyl-3-methyl-5-hydroxy-6-metoxy-1,4-benzoquinol methylase